MSLFASIVFNVVLAGRPFVELPVIWLGTVYKNFAMALLWNLFAVSPLSSLMLRLAEPMRAVMRWRPSFLSSGEISFDFYRTNIEAMREALHDGVDLRGYYAWGPIDIVSCSSSEMAKRYGFIYVDLDNDGKGTGARRKKDSYAWLAKAIRSNGEDLADLA